MTKPETKKIINSSPMNCNRCHKWHGIGELLGHEVGTITFYLCPSCNKEKEASLCPK